jgi:hypothetical protein
MHTIPVFDGGETPSVSANLASLPPDFTALRALAE